MPQPKPSRRPGAVAHSPAWLLLAGLSGLVGCQDYNLHGAGDKPTGEDSGTSSTGTDPLSCADRVLDGFGAEIDETCENEVETGGFRPIIEWSKGSFAAAATYNNVMMQPIVASLTDDDADGDIDQYDVPDIIITSYAGSSWTGAGALRALSGADGRELWTDTAQGIEGSGGVAAGDIDGDGIVELIAVTATGKQAVAFEHDGTVKWTSPNLSLSGCYAMAPAIADMDADGSPEIVVGPYILDSSGNILATGSSGGQCLSFPVDLDGDGQQEVIAGSTVFDITGRTLWTTSQDGYPAVADFDADGQGEVVLVTTGGAIHLYDTDGRLMWLSTDASGNGPPTVADFDGDGQPEIGVAGSSTYTVIDGDGRRLWQNSTTDASSGRTGSSVFDFEGDGVAEVVYADEYTLWVYSGVDGTVKLEESNHTSWTWVEYATIADVDGDDQAEIILPNGSISGSSSGAYYGVSVIGDADESWMPARPIWNQHAYSITNVDDDGGIPARPEANWLTYNSFRSGDLRAGVGTQSPDAVVALGDICELDCDVDRLRIWLHAGNGGLAGLYFGARLQVSAVVGGSQEVIDSVDVTSSISSGRFLASVQLDIESEDIAAWDALVVDIIVDEPECNVDNNSLLIEGPFCD